MDDDVKRAPPTSSKVAAAGASQMYRAKMSCNACSRIHLDHSSSASIELCPLGISQLNTTCETIERSISLRNQDAAVDEDDDIVIPNCSHVFSTTS